MTKSSLVKRSARTANMPVSRPAAPSLFGFVSRNGEIQVFDQFDDSAYTEAYFRALIDDIESTPIADWPHGPAMWKLTVPTFRIESDGNVIPDELRLSWLKDAANCIRSLRLASLQSPVAYSKLRRSDNHQWKFKASFAPVEGAKIDVAEKRLDLRNELSQGGGATSENALPTKEQKSAKMSELKAAADRVKSAVDAAVAKIADEAGLNEACDEYTQAAKSFAAMILAERIRQSFLKKIDPDTAQSNETAEQKYETAQTIRDMLSPWNLGFLHASKPDVVFQLYSDQECANNGRYRLSGYALARQSHRISKAEEVLQVISAPKLGDATQFVRHSTRGRSQ